MISDTPNNNNINSSFKPPDETCQRLTLANIKLATNNFDESLVIGHGGFGNVYKSLCKFGSVNEVAIKRLRSTSNQGADEFEAEVKLLSNLRHGNLVPLIGYCNEGNEMLLAYEFMPNGTLEDHLHKGDTELSWLQLLNICIGAACGLEYLHTGSSSKHGVIHIHRDVKSSNILLDSDFEAKISDFGLAKVGTINHTGSYHVSTLVKGTFGYIDPCYFQSGKLTRKSDVYAFGVVLFEVLTGKQPLDPTFDEDQPSLAVWAQDHFKGGKLNQIINHRLIGQASKRCLKEFASIAVRCLHDQPKQRPTMAEVVVKLESILSREKEYTGDERLINKVLCFFTGKANGLSVSNYSFSEVVSAPIKFNDEEFSTYSHGTSYKGWADELTYAPTELGDGFAMYLRRTRIRTTKLALKPEEYNHPNLVKLLGYFSSEQNLSSIYQLTPGTCLDKLLFEGTPSLPWFARLKIAVGAAQGLSFLHKKGVPTYRKFKAACILVDADYNARIRDFEVDNSFVDLGSYSFRIDARYAAPEWTRYQACVKFEGTIVADRCVAGSEVKSDIYSFGVVLLELLTGMKVSELNIPQGNQNLVEWATPLLENEVCLRKILDTRLQKNNRLPKGAYMLAMLVLNCLQPTQDERPSMEKIVQVLHKCYQEVLTSKRKTK